MRERPRANRGAEGATAPGISQAKGPHQVDSLESVAAMAGTTEGVSPGFIPRNKLSGHSDRRGFAFVVAIICRRADPWSAA